VLGETHQTDRTGAIDKIDALFVSNTEIIIGNSPHLGAPLSIDGLDAKYAKPLLLHEILISLPKLSTSPINKQKTHLLGKMQWKP
jgi:hypothetical protein